MQQLKLKSVQLATATQDSVHLIDSIIPPTASKHGIQKSKSKQSRHKLKESLNQKIEQQLPTQFILNAEFVSLQTQDNNQGEKGLSQKKKRVTKKKGGGSRKNHVSVQEPQQTSAEYFDYTHEIQQPQYHIIQEDNSIISYDEYNKFQVSADDI